MKEKGKEGKEVRSEEGGLGRSKHTACQRCNGNNGQTSEKAWFKRFKMAAGLMRGHDPKKANV